jgi:hypothetical protein
MSLSSSIDLETWNVASGIHAGLGNVTSIGGFLVDVSLGQGSSWRSLIESFELETGSSVVFQEHHQSQTLGKR